METKQVSQAGLLAQVEKESSVYQSSWLGPSFLVAVSGRKYLKVRFPELLSQCHISQSDYYSVDQVHGSDILEIKKGDQDTSKIKADGLWTRSPELALGIRTADCMPVFFSDVENKIVGIAHAGWRGLEQGILEKMVKEFQKAGSDPKWIRVLIGPSIRKCCYKVSKEFLRYFPKSCAPSKKDKCQMDMISEAKDRLRSAGISENQIGDSGLCTSCLNDQFFSFRKEKTDERIFSLLKILD